MDHHGVLGWRLSIRFGKLLLHQAEVEVGERQENCCFLPILTKLHIRIICYWSDTAYQQLNTVNRKCTHNNTSLMKVVTVITGLFVFECIFIYFQLPNLTQTRRLSLISCKLIYLLSAM